MQSERRTELLDALRDAPRRVEELLRGQRRAVLGWIPAPGKWSIVEIVRHLRDHEIGACLDPYRRIVAGEEPLLPDTDEAAPGAAPGPRGERISELVRVWKRTRRETLALLERLDEAAWVLEARHPAAGPIALGALVEMQVQHDRDHLAQVESNLERHSIFERLENARREMRARVELLAAAAGNEARTLGFAEVIRLRDFEGRMLERYVWILERDRPALRPAEAAARVDVPAGTSLLDCWREFEQLRGGTLEFLHATSARLWQRRGVNPHHGDITIAELVAQHLDHDAARLAALRALTERRAGATLVRAARRPEAPRPTV